MIELTKLNKNKFILNCELIETLESTPDTIITLRNGKLYIVAETPAQVIEKIMHYKKQIMAVAFLPQHKNADKGDEGK